MKQISAIGFDLFNTLIIAQVDALNDAVGRLILSLHESGFEFEAEPFKKIHREEAVGFIHRAKKSGLETHNSLWISAALKRFGYTVPRDDTRICTAVNAYFSAFFDYCRLIPGTREMLRALEGRYRLGLLSNFTHAPAALGLVDHLGLRPFFDVVVISGKLGFRKPNPIIFDHLMNGLGVSKDQIIYIGDDLESDITGAKDAGIQPVWMTYVRDRHLAPVPGYFADAGELPGEDTPRISNWEDLLGMLADGV
ncbi:MAG: HAD family hydrolase [Thermodesulfobacteriota bacterium]